MDDLIPASEMKNLFPGTTDQTWAGRRFRGTGPVFIRLGGEDEQHLLPPRRHRRMARRQPLHPHRPAGERLMGGPNVAQDDRDALDDHALIDNGDNEIGSETT